MSASLPLLDVSCDSGDNDFLQYFIFRNLDQLVYFFVLFVVACSALFYTTLRSSELKR